MLVDYHATFLILWNFIRITEEVNTITLYLMGYPIPVQLDMYIEFSMSETDKAVLDDSEIKDVSLNSAETELSVKFMNSDASKLCEIYCTLTETQSHFTLGGCAIKVQTGVSNNVHNFVIGHKFKLSKKTKYDLANYNFNFKLDTYGLKYFGFVLNSLVFTVGAGKTCELKNTNMEYYSLQFNSPTLVTLCKSEDEKIYTESYALDQPKPEIKPSENEKQEEIEHKEANDEEQGDKEQKDQEQGDTEEGENADDAVTKDEDVEDLESESPRIIIIISITVVLILISLVIIGIYLFKKGDIPAKIQRALSS
ncbi:hypothetical protein RF11_01427 [Thelohanellus kitauei]|uniref:Uncharacterized protein n=1 Tax=Thelohanellus kitauei TaxID=669202 RepID=A0A0C2IU61_THEKT|nr:hypothetical protein RF11_01427 [Thelohanellus kitauei]